MDSKAIYKLMVKKCPNTKRNKHYLKRYVRFIAACLEKNEELSEDAYTEKHHILPKSKHFWPEYGSFSQHPWNLAVLTADQHFIAHWILARALEGTMWYAFNMMFNVPSELNKELKDRNRYKECRINISKLLSEKRKGSTMSKEHRKIISDVNRNRTVTLSTREKLSNIAKNRKKKTCPNCNVDIPVNVYGRFHGDNCKAKDIIVTDGEVTITVKDNNIPDGFTKVKKSKKGTNKRPKSEETKRRMREAAKRRPILKCPHCGKEGKSSGMTTFHFDNCKSKI